MTFTEAAMIMMSGNGGNIQPSIDITENGEFYPDEGFDGIYKINVNVPSVTANIIPLSVIDPGVYRAADYGCDGFDPVYVSDIYKRLYEESIGNGDDLFDDSGEEIPNAISSDDIGYLTDLLEHVQFGPYGGSVTVQGLDADTSFTFKQKVTKVIYADGTVRYRTGAHGTITHLRTGKTVNVSSGKNYEPADGSIAKLDISDVTFYSRSLVQVGYNILYEETIRKHSMDFNAGSVGGTCFYNTKPIATTTNQNTQPDETIDYS